MVFWPSGCVVLSSSRLTARTASLLVHRRSQRVGHYHKIYHFFCWGHGDRHARVPTTYDVFLCRGMSLVCDAPTALCSRTPRAAPTFPILGGTESWHFCYNRGCCVSQVQRCDWSLLIFVCPGCCQLIKASAAAMVVAGICFWPRPCICLIDGLLHLSQQ